ncbi:hypothetical protein DJ71_17300 [Halorubrum sp. E3]|uniref:Uncharacterized protein n=1 Tax=Halorubrum persicum TaxID=1383844 RepID=A0A2G1WHG9_9EURY|nr:hypothetical protein [Halorubrum persicum]OYR78648.1 hypothetical protein DJ71_17300 [Halorubrum sp. E3]PHQ38289.1 hypothetical protein DJ69_12465 [Halorubrum persicum]
MGVIETLRSWLGLGGNADREEAETTAGDTATADPPAEDAADADGEPRLDPEGATETRVETTETAVDALREARNADDEDSSGDTVDADDRGIG